MKGLVLVSMFYLASVQYVAQVLGTSVCSFRSKILLTIFTAITV